MCENYSFWKTFHQWHPKRWPVKVNISTILSIVLMTSSSLLVQVFHYLSPKRSTHITHRLIESMTPEHSRAEERRRRRWFAPIWFGALQRWAPENGVERNVVKMKPKCAETIGLWWCDWTVASVCISLLARGFGDSNSIWAQEFQRWKEYCCVESFPLSSSSSFW